jgi:hypothetical protein
MYGTRQKACILFLLPLILFRIPNLKCPPLRNKEEEEEGEGEEESDAEEEPASARTRIHRNSVVVVVVVGARVSRIWDSFGAALKLQSGTESRSRLCF